MNRIVIYHGSDHIITKPSHGVGDLYADYGQAFYCTSSLDMAKEWANKNTASGYANKYTFDGRGLKVLDLTSDSHDVLHWIAVLLHHRKLGMAQRDLYRRRLEFLEKHFYIDARQYDVIIGYRADDAYFKFPLFFLQNELSMEKLHEIYHLGNLGKQIAIVSEKAFGRIKYIASIEAEPVFHERCLTAKNKADARFEEMRIEDINSDKEKIEDLMRDYDQRQ